MWSAFPGLGAARVWPRMGTGRGVVVPRAAQSPVCPGIALSRPAQFYRQTYSRRANRTAAFPRHMPVGAGLQAPFSILGPLGACLRNGDMGSVDKSQALGFSYFQTSTQRTLHAHKASALLSYRQSKEETKPEGRPPAAHPTQAHTPLGPLWACSVLSSPLQ